MEFPDVGKHCSKQNCNKLDFLPIKCDACSKIFCDEHFSYSKHNCSKAYLKDNQVPVCPLCNKPIPVAQGLQADYVVGAHIDTDCQSDPAKNKRKVFTNKCSKKGCKIKEVVPILCDECGLNFCLKHRHVQDHQCLGKQGAAKQKMLDAAISRQKTSNATNNKATDQMSEDEALARALALSMQETSNAKTITEQELDFILARELQASEYQTTTASRTTNRDRCTVS